MHDLGMCMGYRVETVLHNVGVHASDDDAEKHGRE